MMEVLALPAPFFVVGHALQILVERDAESAGMAGDVAHDLTRERALVVSAAASALTQHPKQRSRQP